MMQVYQINQDATLDVLVERLLVATYKMQSMINLTFDDPSLCQGIERTELSAQNDALYCLWAVSDIAGQMRLLSEAIRERSTWPA